MVFVVRRSTIIAREQRPQPASLMERSWKRLLALSLKHKANLHPGTDMKILEMCIRDRYKVGPFLSDKKMSEATEWGIKAMRTKTPSQRTVSYTHLMRSAVWR